MQDHEAERAVLLGMLTMEKNIFEAAAMLLPESFSLPEHQAIFKTIIEQARTGKPSSTMIKRALEKHPDYEYIVEALDMIHYNAFVDSPHLYYIKEVQGAHTKRQYMETAAFIKEAIQTDTPINEITDIVQQKIIQASAGAEDKEQIITPEIAATSALSTLEERIANPVKISGIKLSRDMGVQGMIDGFPSIDQALMGLKGGDLVFIAAETGEGKTTLAQNFVRHASIHQAFNTFYQNTEMSRDEMVFRFAAQLSRVEFSKIYSGDLDEYEAERVRTAIELFRSSNVYLSELPVLTPERSLGLSRQFKMRYGNPDLIVIDYIGRMELESSKGKQEWQVLKEIAKNSKRLAQELGATVILIGQLNEDGTIQNSKQIINETDAAFFLEPLRTEEDLEGAPSMATHRLRKKKVRRGSKAGDVWVSFNKPFMYITEVT